MGGLLALAPLLVTFWLASFVYLKMTGWAVTIVGNLAPDFLHMFGVRTSIRILTLLLIIALLLFVGEFTRYRIGKAFTRFTEWLLLKLPILNSIYRTSREIGEALWTPKGNMFSKVVLIEYPRKGIFTLGFLTNENTAGCEPSAKTGKDLLSVFVPTTPNPTSGFLLFIPREDCTVLDMKVSEGMKLVISGGVSK